jgi:hypothetical protein
VPSVDRSHLLMNYYDNILITFHAIHNNHAVESHWVNTSDSPSTLVFSGLVGSYQRFGQKQRLHIQGEDGESITN